MTQIVADTLSSIPVQEAAKLGIYYLPQIIIFGDESYRDDTEIDTATFLKKLRSSNVLPKTAAPPPALYTDIFKSLSDKGEQVVVLCPSAELSGTYRSATVAAQDFPEASIHVVDTHTIGGALATLVYKAVDWANQGFDADAIVTEVVEMAQRQQIYFLVDTLEYLHKGGRIGGAQAFIGGILQVKPILMLTNGRIEPCETQWTKKRALSRIYELVENTYPGEQDGYLCLMQGDAVDEAKNLASELRNKLHISTEIPIYELPPAILVHAGPGVLGVCYYKK